MMLLTPLDIGPITVRNRVVSTAHGAFLDFYRPGVAADQYVAYQARRAEGGCGLIVLQAMQTHPSSQTFGHHMWDRGDVTAKFAAMSRTLHDRGAKTVVQIVHFGAQFRSDGNDDLAPLWSFSPMLSPSGWEASHEMTAAEIESVLAGFVHTAAVAVEGGLDGVELHATHGYLVQQSFSPWANRRDDEWGNQLHFLDELMGRVREAIGPDKVMGLRISAEDWIPPDQGGLGVDGLAAVAGHACRSGLIDYLNHSEGARSAHYARAIGDYYSKAGEFLPLTSGLRAVSAGIPVIAVGKILTPDSAEQALQNGHCDLVAMTRAQIADPDVVRKTESGDSARIRPCVGANSGCVDRMSQAMPITCFHNPDVGREWRLEDVRTTAAPRRVLVMGAGPAGLKAAEVAARRGHDVTVIDRNDQPGGALRLVAKLGPPGELLGAVEWIVRELELLGVSIRLGEEVDASTLAREHADDLIIATGADGPAFVTSGLVPTVGTETAMEMDVHARAVVLADQLGTHEQAGCAEHMAAGGAAVTIVTPFPQVGQNIGFTHIRGQLERLYALGVTMHTSTVVTGYDGGAVTARHVYSKEVFSVPASLVVAGTPGAPRTALAAEAERLGIRVHVAGNAVAPRTALHAFREGDNVGRAI